MTNKEYKNLRKGDMVMEYSLQIPCKVRWKKKGAGFNIDVVADMPDCGGLVVFKSPKNVFLKKYNLV